MASYSLCGIEDLVYPLAFILHPLVYVSDHLPFVCVTVLFLTYPCLHQGNPFIPFYLSLSLSQPVHPDGPIDSGAGLGDPSQSPL